MKPTRSTKMSATTTHHACIWTNILAPLKAGIIKDNTTEHYPTFLITNICKLPMEHSTISFHLHDEVSTNNFTIALGSTV